MEKSMGEAEVAKALASFTCLRCEECCRKPGFVYLSSDEADQMAACLEISPFDFINLYCELQGRQRLVLKKAANEACVFLDDWGCRVHLAKPKQCREFPSRWRTENSYRYCEGLKKCLASHTS